MKIIGYSERGIINSLIFSIIESEDKELMNKFIDLMGIFEFNNSEKPIDYEVLLEQSFSGFGDADLVVIIKYKSHQKVVFIEGKVKTLQSKSWSLEKQFSKYHKGGKYPGYSSNLFFQLYLKSLLFENKDNIKGDDDCVVNGVYRARKIGKNDIVKKALEKIAECDEAFYVGLVPSSKKGNDAFSEHLDYKIHFLSWETVHQFCKDNEKLKKVLEIFEFNEGQIY